MKKKPYRFWKCKDRGGIFYVQFRHIPGKWITTSETDRDREVLAAGRFLKDGATIKKDTLTLNEYANDFFSEADPQGWRRREEALGHYRTERFYKSSAGRLKNYILPEYGGYLLVSLTPRIIQNWILALK